jgi:hypothetical protein
MLDRVRGLLSQDQPCVCKAIRSWATDSQLLLVPDALAYLGGACRARIHTPDGSGA